MAAAARPGAAPDSLVVSRVGPSGGELVLPGYGIARFAAATFPRPTVVALAVTRTAETARDWEATSPVNPATRASWELRLNVGASAPAQPVRILMPVTRGLPQGTDLLPFAQLHQVNAEEVLDGFVRVDAMVRRDTLHFTLPVEAFTDQRRVDGTFEAVIVVAGVSRRQ